MPLYEYQCQACGRCFEIIQKFSAPPPEACTMCGKGTVTRLFSSPAIQFKGSGWYITDYARKEKSDKRSSEQSEGTKSEVAKTDGSAKTETSAKTDTHTAANSSPTASGTKD